MTKLNTLIALVVGILAAGCSSKKEEYDVARDTALLRDMVPAGDTTGPLMSADTTFGQVTGTRPPTTGETEREGNDQTERERTDKYPRN